MSQLFTPIQLGSMTLDNRIVIAPMCQYSAQDGNVGLWHKVHLGNLSLSGASMMIIEATAIAPNGRISPYDLGLWDDSNQQALTSVVQEIRQLSEIKIGIQLGHAGRKASCDAPWQGGAQLSVQQGGWQTVAPSALPYSAGENAPQALKEEQLESLKQQFVSSAQRAVAAGVDLIEIHAAHGYLLHQFLSPLSNQRTDSYGGSLENRLRFPLEVFSAVRKAVPSSVVVGVRLSATDWVEGGWDEAQSISFCQQLESLNCDYLHISSGGLSPQQKIEVGPNYQVPFAKAIRQQVTLPVIAVGLITEAQQAEDIIQQGEADVVALARGILYDPRWPWHAAAALKAEVRVSPQYLRCEPHGVKGTLISSEKWPRS